MPSGVITAIKFDVLTGEDIVKYILDVISISAFLLFCAFQFMVTFSCGIC